MIKGIPYLGQNNQELTEEILKHKKFINKQYKSLYNAIISNINNSIIVIIDHKWLSWLNDIKFNYRDKECYIPYFQYELSDIKCSKRQSNNNGHLILNDETLSIRFNYIYQKLHLDISNIKIKCVDIDTMEYFTIITDKWIEDKEIDFDKLYKLYIESSYNEDDYTYNKHQGGYHYIDRSPKEFKNVEKRIREQYGLETYNINNVFDSDYRDVRNFKYNEIVQKYGFVETIELYRERRLRFESYLYCAIKQGLLNNIKFNRGIYKYGDNIKLIIKEYWIKNIDKPNKTWIK